MMATLQLESFDRRRDSSSTRSPADRKPEGYEAGYAAGLAAAEAAYLQDQAALRSDLVQSVSEAALVYADAQRSLLDAIAPLHDALLETLLPAVLAPALHAHLRELIAAARGVDLTAPIGLSVPPDQEAAIAEALSDINPQSFTLRSDPALSNHAVWVTTQTAETALDLDAALQAIAKTMADLKTLAETQEEIQQNG